MRRYRKILTALTALTIAASALTAMPLQVSAAETQIGTTYTFDGSGDVWTATGQSTVTAENGVLTMTAGGTGGRTGYIAIPTPIVPQDNNPIRVEFNWTSATTPATCSTDLAIADGQDKRILTINEQNNTVKVNGISVDGAPTNARVSAIIDFETKTIIKVTFTSAENTVFVEDVPFANSEAAKIDTLVQQGYRASGTTLSSTITIDNFAAYSSETGDYLKETIAVETPNREPVSGATVKFGSASLPEGVYSSEHTTDANGFVTLKLAPGSYKYCISKPGYETPDGEPEAIITSDVYTFDSIKTIKYRPKAYTPAPETVTVSGGQSSLTAPKTADSFSTTAAYSVEVKDQEDVTCTDADIVWSIAPADDHVEIDPSTGVVTVKKGFNAGDTHVKEFTVTATATLNSESNSDSAKINISDYLFYDSGLNGSSYGETEAHKIDGTDYITTGSTKNQTNTITLPEPVTFTPGTAERVSFDLAMTTKEVFTFKRNISLVGTKDGADATVASLDFVYFDVGTNATWGSSGSTLGTTWGTLDGLNSWKNVSILFTTYANGTTNATLTMDGSEIDLGTINADNISKITLNVGDCGGGTDRYVAMKDISIMAEDAAALDINGPKKFTSVEGNTLTKDYEVLALMVEDGETFNWETTIPGASITADSENPSKATLSVPGDVITGGTIKVTSNKNRTAEIDVDIAAATVASAKINGPSTVHFEEGATETYTVSDVKDQFGDDITEYVTPAWSLKEGEGSGEETDVVFNVDESYVGTTAVAVLAVYDGTALTEVQTVPVQIDSTTVKVAAEEGQTVYLWDSLEGMKPIASASKEGENSISENGVLTVNAKRNETVVATILGEDIELPVTIDTYYLTNPQVTDGKVSIAELVDDDAITGYQVATVTNDTLTTNVVSKGDVTDDKINVTGTPDAIEIAPIFETTIGKEIALPSDTYNITVTANNANRADVYVNDQMVMNNLNQGSDSTWSAVSGAKPESADYTIKDIVVSQGSATFKYQDKSGEPVTSVAMVKAPSIAARTRKVYVIGDSLVANYYDREGAANPNVCRTGWGQVLNNYLKNVDVVNLGNSGAWATGMYHDAFTQVRESAKPGDIVLWESGYNDRAHSNEKDMKEAITAAVNECKEMGVDIYLITPNASAHDLKPSPQYAGYMRDLHDTTNAPLIDLAQMSFEFLNAHYGEFNYDGTYYSFPSDELRDVEISNYHNANDTLHSTLNAANVWASMIAGKLYDAGEGNIVNTNYTYTFTDTKTNPETFTVRATPARN